MKRSQSAVPKAETGAIRGDYRGSQGMKMPQGATRNPNVGTRGSGIAPKPAGGAKLFNANASLGAQAGLARIGGAGKGDAGLRMPVQHPTANIASTKIGQTVPDTGAVATKKPNRKGGSAFYGES